MFILEGNIGAGKTTFLKMIRDHLPHVSVELEPVARWDSKDAAQSLLYQFIENPKRWAFSMETYTLLTRAQGESATLPFSDVHIAERSIYSGHYCFARNCYQQGFMEPHEWDIYLQFFSRLVPQFCRIPRGFIYLKTDPEIAYTRIKKRQRTSESGITAAYLKQIHEIHEQFLVHKKDLLPELCTVPVLCLDGNKEFAGDQQHAQHLAHQVYDFMQRLREDAYDNSCMCY